ncbi:MAG: FkbM family methyltransferase [Verrucomicrobiota bacterium]
MKDPFAIPPKFFLPDNVRESLRRDPLRFADVGGAMGLGERWNPVRDCLEVMSFEPDARSGADGTVHRIALGDKQQKSRTLHLARMSAASGFYDHHPEMKRFVVDEWLETVGSESVATTTLDHVSDGKPVDFLKLDVEGAELEVLRGAGETLKNVLALQVEVSFTERHVGAPLFAEVDSFLIDHGFRLHHIESERWLRNNKTCGSNSNAQLIWGDAVYLRNHADWIEDDFPKWLLILQAYGFHDYGVDRLPEDWRMALQRAVRSHGTFFAMTAWRWILATLLMPVLWKKMLPRWKRLTARIASTAQRLAVRTGPGNGIFPSGPS